MGTVTQNKKGGLIAAFVVLGFLGFGIWAAIFNDSEYIPNIPTFSTPTSSFDTNIIAQRIFQLTNEERIDAGLQPVAWDQGLANIGLAHVKDMATNNYFDHNSLNGRTPNQRAQDVGYVCQLPPYFGVAENLSMAGPYYGQNSNEAIAQETVDGWMSSPLHAKNILTAQHRSLGVAIAFNSDGDQAYVTQEFC